MSVRILTGDCLDILATLDADSVDCVVTSPPYWGLRDYGVEGQMGLEPTMGEHIAGMVAVFQAVRRVLKPSGTVWLNYGDCYATAPNGRSAADTKATGNDDRTFRDKPFSTVGGTLKPKDLCMIPNRLAIALQDDGWWVRSEIIWGKRNPMPESIKDRPATAHEKIWMLTKSARYFFDAGAVGVESKYPYWRYAPAANTRNPNRQDGGNTQRKVDKQRGHGRRQAGFNDRWNEKEPDKSRNLRNYEPAPLEVWPMSTRPFPDAHFATFPPELAERCIKAGCPAGGLVLDPFGGAGTTGLVADRLQRDAILIELNPDYAAMAERRISDEAGMFGQMEAAK